MRDKTIFTAVINVFRQMKWPARILLLVIVVALFASGAIVVTGQPGFCNSCHIMNPYYANWKTSGHSHVNCLDCHLQPGFAGYIKGKINGLAQAVDCAVGRIGTKPSATVKDASCLRSECHSTGEIASKKIDYNGVKFTHEKHMVEAIDGIRISCGTCHSHFEGDEHFSVNNEVCFTCHFLRGIETEGNLVRTNCTACHDVPDTPIKRGLVTINHAEFISYKASCEESCHKNEIQMTSKVDGRVCLNCHSFSKDQHASGTELHEAHTAKEKVECFACHGQVPHGQTAVASLAVMMDCRNCHSDTHQVQRTIYATEHPMQEEATDRVLSPMFLTHVECTGCHIERVQKRSGVLDSFGTVAKAVPRACDACHEEGTGQQYVSFWQGKIKAKFEQVRLKVANLEAQAQVQSDEETVKKLRDKIGQARAILESVTSDGSWGVHNFKYTEAMLARAEEIVSGAR
ncbi:MAG: NapC/NirT family cytochrome c [Phycisphaerales bacterium]|nr:MAG: NapC/NirT family cytochrome c [Phycisphaerales bacterium]